MKKYLTIFSAAVMFVLCCTFAFAANADAPVDISTGEIALSTETYTYNQNEKKPKVTLTLTQINQVTLQEETVTLVKDTDYTLSYENNINAGTATVTATGIGAYTGTLSKDYTIAPCKLKSYHIKITNLKRAYPGKAPKYKVEYDSTLLKEGVDYNLTVSNYAKAGVKSAKVVFEGTGNFKGKKTLKVNVYPNKVKSVKTKKRTPNSIELTWASQKDLGVSGYRVYTCNKKGKNSSLYKTVSTNSCTVTNRKAGTYYYFYVVAIKTSDKTKVSGEASKVFKTCTKPAQVMVNFVTKSKDKSKLKVEWQKVNCTGYELEYSTDKSFKKGVKKIVINGSSKTSKKIKIKKNDKVYYVRIRAFRRYNDGKTTVYGKRSSKISSSFSKLYATYTTNYVYNPPRTVNLKLACKAINGTIVYPGEVFSFNRTVGRRTAEKGYKEAYVFTGPTTHQMGIGGGVCQVASTMFNAALRANFGIVERHQHAQRVTYCPLGRDAAIYWGSEDFKFRNTTNYPIKIKMNCGDGRLTCSYYVCYDVSHKKVDLNVYRNGNHFTLKRTVDGKVNYTTYSTY